MQPVIDWLGANWALSIPLFFTLLGVVLHFKANDPKWLALRDAVLAIGLDIPKLYNAVKALFTKDPPTGGAGADPGAAPPPPDTKPDLPGTMRVARGFGRRIALAFAGLLLLIGCAKAWRLIDETEKWACVAATELTDAKDVAKACDIIPELLADVEKALAGKAAAHRASMAMRASSDAGADAADGK